MYTIRFDGIKSTSVCAGSLDEALEIARMFEQRGMTKIVIAECLAGDEPSSETATSAHKPA